ncbi:Outer membrane protein TolC [Serratia symbiotica]|nr:Outer membrane protein TolC [Serratia symbiotica]
MKKIFSFLIVFILNNFITISKAENLLQIYKKAKENNFELNKYLIDRNIELEKIKEVKSVLLPQFNLNNNYSYNNNYYNNNITNSNETNVSLTLTQSILDMYSWNLLKIQKKIANISNVNLETSSKKLILNTTISYFNILHAIEILSYKQQQKKIAYKILNQTNNKFNIGLITIHDLQNIQSNYNTSVLEEIIAHNKLDNTLEELYKITGIFYQKFSSFDINNLNIQNPKKLYVLIKYFKKNNRDLLSAYLNKDLALEKIYLFKTNYMPTIKIIASIGIINSKNNTSNINKNLYKNNIKQNKISLNINLPLFINTKNNSQTQQAKYHLINTNHIIKNTQIDLEKNIHTLFNDINASINNINIYKTEVILNQKYLKNIKTAYQIGSKNNTDILLATNIVYTSQQKLLNSYYSYFINQLKLKSLLDILNENDLINLNKILGKSIIIDYK